MRVELEEVQESEEELGDGGEEVVSVRDALEPGLRAHADTESEQSV